MIVSRLDVESHGGQGMARKYTVHHTIAMTPQDSANVSALQVNAMVDLPLLLSQRLQRNVRQGHVIHLHKVSAQVRPVVDGEYDLGTSVVGEIYHCPATKNSAKAWRHAFAVWRKQKMLKVGALGPTVRNDDFEIGWNNDLKSGRTSTIKTTGMNDDTDEDVVIYGTSSDDDELTLQDMFNSLQPLPSPSRFPIGNSVVKEAKYTTTFPMAQKTPFVAHWSGKHSDNNTPTGVLDWTNVNSGMSGSISQFELQDTGTLCGVLRVRAFLGPGDDATTTPDEAVLALTFTVSIGTPLAITTGGKKKAVRRTSGAKGGRRAKRSRRKS